MHRVTQADTGAHPQDRQRGSRDWAGVDIQGGHHTTRDLRTRARADWTGRPGTTPRACRTHHGNHPSRPRATDASRQTAEAADDARPAPAHRSPHLNYREGADPHKQEVAAKSAELLYCPRGQAGSGPDAARHASQCTGGLAPARQRPWTGQAATFSTGSQGRPCRHPTVTRRPHPPAH